MLIIAIPKSASTALMATMSELHEKPGKQIFFPDAPDPAGFDALRRYHSDVREIDAVLAARFDARDQVFKQHLPPTPNNIAQLHDCKKVILLREPKAIIAAYRRARRRFLSVSMPGFDLLASEEAWLRRAMENGLYGDLENFIDGWLGDTVGNKLIVWYDDLVGDATGSIHAVEAFWGWEPATGHVRLVRQRYSGRGAWREGLFRLAREGLKRAHLWAPARAAARRFRRQRS